MKRRDFLRQGGLFAGFVAANGPSIPVRGDISSDDLSDWRGVRAQFALTPEYIHLAGFLLVSHPRPVREAIELHRRKLDANPAGYLHEQRPVIEDEVRAAAADYMGVQPVDIALTDSTTMGLGLLYGGLRLRAGQEVLTTVHDHYSTDMSLKHRAERTGTTVRKVTLYEDASKTSVDGVVQAIVRGINDRTRVLAVTWVHSCSGVKLPLRAIADAVAEVNAGRDEEDRILLCVDGVHGFGIEDVTMADLGCDFFVAGTHKWIFGPRGTGLVWGKPEAWPSASVIIPPFDRPNYGAWMKLEGLDPPTPGSTMSPGGFHSFEHRWALGEAFRFHLAIGKARVEERIHALNTQAKAGLAKMSHVKLHTPMDERLSAGIICFEVDGLSPAQVVEKLHERAIIASVTPYATQYARIAPGLINSPEEIDRTLGEIAKLT